MKAWGQRYVGPSQGRSEIDAMLQPVLDALIDPDDGRRQDLVRRVQSLFPPAALCVIVDRLVELLAAGKASVRRQAAASLTDIGPPALAALRSLLVARRRPRMQCRAAEILTAMLLRLESEQRVNLTFDAMIVGMQTRAAAVQCAMSQLIAAVRNPAGPGAGCSRDGSRCEVNGLIIGGDVRGLIAEQRDGEAPPDDGETPPAPAGEVEGDVRTTTSG